MLMRSERSKTRSSDKPCWRPSRGLLVMLAIMFVVGLSIFSHRESSSQSSLGSLDSRHHSASESPQGRSSAQRILPSVDNTHSGTGLNTGARSSVGYGSGAGSLHQGHLPHAMPHGPRPAGTGGMVLLGLLFGSPGEENCDHSPGGPTTVSGVQQTAASNSKSIGSIVHHSDEQHNPEQQPQQRNFERQKLLCDQFMAHRSERDRDKKESPAGQLDGGGIGVLIVPSTIRQLCGRPTAGKTTTTAERHSPLQRQLLEIQRGGQKRNRGESIEMPPPQPIPVVPTESTASALFRQPLPSNQQQAEAPSGSSVIFEPFSEWHCTTLVSNVCLKSGESASALTLYGPRGAKRRGSTFRGCNEGTPGKTNPYLLAEIRPYVTEGAKHEEGSERGLHVVFCWDYYGYHLWYCLLALYTKAHRTLQLLLELQRATNQNTSSFSLDWGNVCDEAPTTRSHCFTTEERQFLVSNASVVRSLLTNQHDILVAPSETSELSKQTDLSNPLWRSVLDFGSGQSSPIQRAAGKVFLTGGGNPKKPEACEHYDYVSAGSVLSSAVSKREWQRFSRHVINTLVPSLSTPSLQCTGTAAGGTTGQSAIGSIVEQINVTIVQRVKRYRFQNIERMKAVLEEVFSAPFALASPAERLAKQVHVQVVEFERYSQVEQLRIARETQVLVGIHGNGLTWGSLMEPRRGAILEVWPASAFNGNYRTIAEKMDLFYASVEHIAGVRGHKMRFDTYTNPFLLRTAAEELKNSLFQGLRGYCASTRVGSSSPVVPLQMKDSSTGSSDDQHQRRGSAVSDVPRRSNDGTAAERMFLLDLVGAVRSHKLWDRFGLRKKHYSQAVMAFIPPSEARLGLDASLAKAYSVLSLEHPILPIPGPAAPNGTTVAEQCLRCIRAGGDKREKGECLVACVLIFRVVFVELYDFPDRAALQAVQQTLANQDTERRQAEAKHRQQLEEAQDKYFSEEGAAGVWWRQVLRLQI